MTLIAARRVRGAVAVTADWRLAYDHGRPSYQTGALKVMIVHANVVCAYAGNIISALSAIRDVADVESSVAASDFLPDMVAGLQAASATGECDFIVAHTSPEAKLLRIRNGEMMAVERAAQIGDPQGVEAFLEAEQSRRPLFDNLPPLDDPNVQARIEASEVSTVLDSLLLHPFGPTLPTIGELSILTTNWPNGFRYSQTQRVVLTQDQIIGGDDEGRRQNEEARRIDGGSLRLNVCPAKNPGVGALALHFPQHRIGLFTYPMRVNAEVVTYTDADSHQLAYRVLADYGVPLDVPPGYDSSASSDVGG